MNFDFSPDQKALRDQARKFLGEHASSVRVRRILDTDEPYDRDLWRGVAEMGIPQMIPDARTRIICYCAGGTRSALVADNLAQMGYETIESMIGGFQAWVRSGGKVVR